MEIKKSTRRTIQITKDILCNKCGKSCIRFLGKPKTNEANTYDFYGVSINYAGGFLSTELLDGTTYEFHLCEKCLKELIDTLKIQADQINELDV